MLELASHTVTSEEPTSPAIATDTVRNKAIAYRAQYELLVDKDMSALDRYWGDYYLQHNPGLRNGLPELKIFKTANVPGATTELVRCFGDRDLVFFQERVSGLMPNDLCFFDTYRLEGGKIVEHWDACQEIPGPNPAGHTIFDGPTEIKHPEETEATRAVVTALVSRVFVMDQMDVLDRYVAPGLIQHTPGLHGGIAGLNRRFLEAQWFSGAINYIALRRVIAEGEFAVTCSQAEVGGLPFALYDMWRVSDGKVVEHWGLSQQAKKSAFHDNPMI
jgi:predicted SnoaL-like aldol condensation-catalyzing enzyme